MLTRTTQKRPRPLSLEQSEALCQAPLQQAHLPPAVQLRDAAILRVLSTGGLRGAELRALDLEDAHIDVPEAGLLALHIRGARNRGRVVPLGGAAVEALLQYLPHRRERADASETALFVTPQGRRLTSRELGLLVCGYGQKVGLEISAHQLRASCGGQLLIAGTPWAAIRQFLGHVRAGSGDPPWEQDPLQLYLACHAERGLRHGS